MRRDTTKRSAFVGVEVEATKAQGLRTLFLAGEHNLEEVASLLTPDIQAVYIGANQSYRSLLLEDYVLHLFEYLRDRVRYVTLDAPEESWRNMLKTCKVNQLTSSPQFIPMVSYQSQYLQALGENACLKLDDDVTSVKGPGVWVLQVSKDLTEEAPNFTPWSAYREDKEIA